jgi:two-component system, LytTR family, sensor kinase
VENAYVHGLSKLDRSGELSIRVCKDGQRVQATITNSGLGLRTDLEEHSNGYGVGLENVKNRLRLHYGDKYAFSILEVDATHVRASISFPLQLSTGLAESLTRFGV